MLRRGVPRAGMLPLHPPFPSSPHSEEDKALGEGAADEKPPTPSRDAPFRFREPPLHPRAGTLRHSPGGMLLPPSGRRWPPSTIFFPPSCREREEEVPCVPWVPSRRGQVPGCWVAAPRREGFGDASLLIRRRGKCHGICSGHFVWGDV